MKIESDTLYQQWRNLTVLYPHRCDPNWVDFEVSVIMDPELKSKIEAEQVARGRSVRPGYEAFIEDMNELVRPKNRNVIPKVGAGFLAARYQMLPGIKMDYILVPKLSCASAVYRSASSTHKIIRSENRFTLTSLVRSGESLAPTLAGKERWDEGRDYEFRNFKYDEQEPLPTDKPAGMRGARSAELEWISLNMLASYRFDKASVQLLYVPLLDPVFNAHLPKITKTEARPGPAPKGKVRDLYDVSRVKRASRAGKKYSKRVKITANSLLNEGFGETQLDILNSLTETTPLPETETDMITGRRLVDSEEVENARLSKLQELEDRKQELETRLTFSRRHPLVYRQSDPSDPSRKGDPNKGWLFLPDLHDQLLDNWYVRVFDSVQGEVVTKSVDEWQFECSLDGVPIMQVSQINWCLSKGLSVDQVLLLSPKVNDAVDTYKLREIVNDFIREELSLR